MLPANMNCPECGHNGSPSARFCGACGTRLSSIPAATRTTTPVHPASSAMPVAAPNLGHADRAAPAMPRPTGAWRAGMLLGSAQRYRITRTLGRGGFGQTYLAFDTQLGRSCVVKRPIINPNWSSDAHQRILENFEREARLLVDLNAPGHPNIPEIYEYLAESHCLVMKYIAGQSLLHVLKRRVDPLPEADALRYIRDACSALVYMHSRTPEPILHRDIKPDNILIDSEDRVWVIDFGLSKAIPAQSSAQNAQRSQAAGTVGYAPIEQWQSAAEPRSDIYALAATLYTLLTNHAPSAGFAALMQEPSVFRPLRQFNPDIRPEVEQLIQRGLAADVKMRPTAQGFLADLESALDAEVPAPPAPKRPPDVVDFVGRTAELSSYAQHLASTHIAVMTGMAGVGKTTLAAILARQVARPDKLFWHPFHQGEGVDAIIWDLAAFLAWHGQDDLWRLLHKTRRANGQLPPAELLVDYLIQMIRGQGYVLCLDDFHYVDEDPLLSQLIERLQPELRVGQAALIVTARRAPAFVATSERESLEGLSAADTRSLLARRGIALPEHLTLDLFTHTGGNAQFLMLSIAALQRATDPAQLIASLSSTADIEQYLLRQVDTGLSDVERAAMGAVAILLGYGGTRDAIEAILDSGGIWRTLTDLSDRHLLILSEGAFGREYRQHAIVQAFYYNLLGRRERQVLHSRAGAYYERDEPDVLKAARHYQSAGEHPRAADLATADVWSLINHGQARTLSHVLEQFDAQRLDIDRWVTVNVARGEIYALLSEHQAARTGYSEALSGLDALPDSPALRQRRARICRGLGESWEHESSQQALEWLRRGLDELAGDHAPEEAFLRFAIGSVLIGTGELAAAAQAIDTSLSLLPAIALDWRARALMNLGVIHCSQGDLDRGKAYFLHALEIYQQTHNEWRMAAIRQNLGMLKDIAGDWAGAAAEYRQALDIAERLGDVVRQVELTLPLGNLHVKQGDTEAGRGYLLACLALVRHHALREQLVYVQASLAHLHIQLEDWDEAAAALAEAEQTARDMAGESHPQLPEIDRGWALLRLGRGQPDAAIEAAERSVRQARELEASLDEGMGLRVLGQALLAAGRRDEALESFAQSLALLDDNDPYEAARTRAAWGLALAGDEQGLGLLHEARTTFEKLGARGDLATINTNLRHSSGGCHQMVTSDCSLT